MILCLNRLHCVLWGVIWDDFVGISGIVAWIFFMVFALIGALIVLFLGFCGLRLEDSIILTISSITTNGNLTFLAIDNFSYEELALPVKVCLLFGMLVGRFEILAILAVLLPNRHLN